MGCIVEKPIVEVQKVWVHFVCCFFFLCLFLIYFQCSFFVKSTACKSCYRILSCLFVGQKIV